jgi:aminoglycoside phosphotransferase (APT) family kinase protein
MAEAFEALGAAIARRFGNAARIENLEVATLGGSNRTLLFDLVEKAGRRRLVSRQQTYQAGDSPFLSPEEQFRVMREVYACGLPVPEPIFVYDAADGMDAGFVTAFVAGETVPKRIQADAEASGAGGRMAAQLGGLLGRLHGLPVERFAFLAGRADSVDPLAAQRDRYDAYGQIRPVIEYGLRWLERNRPPPRPARLVHGDFRLGNFMVQGSAITSLLDWECAHLGSGAEDIGWLCTRSWRFSRPDLAVGGLAGIAPLLAAYGQAGGRVWDAEERRWWEIFGLTRWAILNLMQAEAHMRGTRRGPVYAACGRNTALVEYDLMMTLTGGYA